jgi:tetratricopeptide (TPR) repeat protein
MSQPMLRDQFGQSLTTTSPVAVEAYDRAVTSFLEWSASSVERFQAATAEDPQLAVAHAGLAVGLFMDERFAEARAAAQTARVVSAAASERERAHVEALALFVEVRIPAAEARMREHVRRYPRDLMIAQRLYFVWFFQGLFHEMRDLTGALMPLFDTESTVPGLHAFVLEELGDCDTALRLAEAAVRRNPEDTWAVHALAHALYEMASFDSGAERMPGAIDGCTRIGWYRNHLLWHVVLMHLGRGDYDRASALTHTVFEHEPSPLQLDMRNSVSLLWRFALCGMDVAARWAPFAEMARLNMDRPEDLPFHHPHLAMALAGGGDWVTAERHLQTVRAKIPPAGTGVIAEVVVPLIQGLHAFAAGDWAGTIRRIEPLRPRIVQLGGSRAQRDVFHDTLLEACFRAGDGERAHRLLAERVARRPDHYWLNRRLAPV